MRLGAERHMVKLMVRGNTILCPQSQPLQLTPNISRSFPRRTFPPRQDCSAFIQSEYPAFNS